MASVRSSAAVALGFIVIAAACGGDRLRSAAAIRACVEKRVPADAIDRVFSSTEGDVTSVNFFHNGTEIDMSVFASPNAAMAAEKAEARLGDAHDRRLEHVLYSGGGVIEAAIVRCVK